MPGQRPFSYQLPPDETQSTLPAASTQPPSPPQTHTPPAQSRIQTVDTSQQNVQHSHPPSAWTTFPAAVTADGANNSSHEWVGYPERRFSFAETPIEDSTQDFDDATRDAYLRAAREKYGNGGEETSSSSQAQRTESPQHPAGDIRALAEQESHKPSQPNTIQLNAPATAEANSYPSEKVSDPQRMPSAYRLRPPEEPHPATFAPDQDSSHAARMSGQQGQWQQGQQWSPPRGTSSASPLSQRGSQYSYTAHQQLYTSDDNKPQAIPRPPPQIRSSGPVPFTASTYTPHAAAPKSVNGPTAMVPDTTYQHSTLPGGERQGLGGQSSGTAFNHNLFSCSPNPFLCFTGLFCPCVSYSRLSARLSRLAVHQDPIDLSGTDSGCCSSRCAIYTFFCLCGGVGACALSALMQRRVRRIYGIGSRGDAGACANGLEGDVTVGICCSCCALVRGEREVLDREKQWRGGNNAAYARVDSMIYPTHGA